MTDARDVFIRSLPDAAYELLRRLAYERRQKHGEIIAEALQCLADRDAATRNNQANNQ